MIHRMDDFASAAMLRVLAAGLAALGVAIRRRLPR